MLERTTRGLDGLERRKEKVKVKPKCSGKGAKK